MWPGFIWSECIVIGRNHGGKLVVCCEVTLFAVAATNHSALSSDEIEVCWDKVRWDAWYKLSVTYGGILHDDNYKFTASWKYTKLVTIWKNYGQLHSGTFFDFRWPSAHFVLSLINISVLWIQCIWEQESASIKVRPTTLPRPHVLDSTAATGLSCTTVHALLH